MALRRFKKVFLKEDCLIAFVQCLCCGSTDLGGEDSADQRDFLVLTLFGEKKDFSAREI